MVLLITFGGLVAAGLPLLTALIGVGGTSAALLIVAGSVSMPTTAPTLAIMLGLAVGIDYALFIVARHRSQLAGGMTVAESIARSIATAGSAVVFAGLTVVIAPAGPTVVRIPFLTAMGLSAAGAVIVGVLVAITLMPALLGFAGERLRPQPVPAPRGAKSTAKKADGRQPVGRAGHPAPALDHGSRRGRAGRARHPRAGTATRPHRQRLGPPRPAPRSRSTSPAAVTRW